MFFLDWNLSFLNSFHKSHQYLDNTKQIQNFFNSKI